MKSKTPKNPKNTLFKKIVAIKKEEMLLKKDLKELQDTMDLVLKGEVYKKKQEQNHDVGASSSSAHPSSSGDPQRGRPQTQAQVDEPLRSESTGIYRPRTESTRAQRRSKSVGFSNINPAQTHEEHEEKMNILQQVKEELRQLEEEKEKKEAHEADVKSLVALAMSPDCFVKDLKDMLSKELRVFRENFEGIRNIVNEISDDKTREAVLKIITENTSKYEKALELNKSNRYGGISGGAAPSGDPIRTFTRQDPLVDVVDNLLEDVLALVEKITDGQKKKAFKTTIKSWEMYLVSPNIDYKKVKTAVLKIKANLENFLAPKEEAEPPQLPGSVPATTSSSSAPASSTLTAIPIPGMPAPSAAALSSAATAFPPPAFLAPIPTPASTPVASSSGTQPGGMPKPPAPAPAPASKAPPMPKSPPERDSSCFDCLPNILRSGRGKGKVHPFERDD